MLEWLAEASRAFCEGWILFCDCVACLRKMERNAIAIALSKAFRRRQPAVHRRRCLLPHDFHAVSTLRQCAIQRRIEVGRYFGSQASLVSQAHIMAARSPLPLPGCQVGSGWRQGVHLVALARSKHATRVRRAREKIRPISQVGARMTPIRTWMTERYGAKRSEVLGPDEINALSRGR